jgi:chemotaxis protein CheY-P-specific phosphatase CheC
MESRRKAEIDRFAELAHVGAEQAASAFTQLVGRTIRTEPPVVIQGDAMNVSAPSGKQDSEWTTGVFFEFDGCVDALVGILFPGAASEALVRCIVGIESGELSPPLIESALMEVGNILASHVASGIADTMKSRLLPSIPALAMENAEEALRTFIEDAGGRDAVRIESAISDETGNLRGRLVLVPTQLLWWSRDRPDCEEPDV